MGQRGRCWRWRRQRGAEVVEVKGVDFGGEAAGVEEQEDGEEEMGVAVDESGSRGGWPRNLRTSSPSHTPPRCLPVAPLSAMRVPNSTHVLGCLTPVISKGILLLLM